MPLGSVRRPIYRAAPFGLCTLMCVLPRYPLPSRNCAHLHLHCYSFSLAPFPSFYLFAPSRSQMPCACELRCVCQPARLLQHPPARP